ncbi:MAG: thiol peroxidase [Isosphaeraceae bacterium]|nr:thiol peroxidase [Isosphaeraceae bacterium]
MSAERTGEVTMKGNPVTLAGPKLSAGDAAPDFTCVNDSLAAVGLKDSAGKVRLFSVVPSLDTPVCNIQTNRFAKELNEFGDKVVAFTVSLDLPFAMKRFCAAHEIKNLVNLSDAHDHSFGKNFGVLITSLPVPLLARAIFVVNASDEITYVELVPEIAQEPNYDAALAAIKAAV